MHHHGNGAHVVYAMEINEVKLMSASKYYVGASAQLPALLDHVKMYLYSHDNYDPGLNLIGEPTQSTISSLITQIVYIFM